MARGIKAEESELLIGIGERIRALRKQAGMGQGELAQRVEVDQTTLYYYEQGKVDIPVSRLLRVAQALNVSPSMLLDEQPLSTEHNKDDLKALVREVLEELQVVVPHSA